jgi:hypothetical protein
MNNFSSSFLRQPYFLLALLTTVFLLPACTSRDKSSEKEPPTKVENNEREVEAMRLMQELDAQLEGYRLLPPEERIAKEAKLGKTLERILDKTAGTKHENKALYFLAAWRLNHNAGAGVAPLLDRLQKSKHLAYKNSGRWMEIELELREGKIVEARNHANALVADVPEFAPAKQLVEFYERVGQKAGRTAGKNLTGGPADPAASSPEPWLLYMFVPQIEGEIEQKLLQYVTELGKREYAGKIRLVCVTFSGNPLDATSVFTALPGTAARELLWANPNDPDENKEWNESWKLPGLPACALLGPDRVIMGVQLAPTDLQRLIGKGVPRK